MPNNLIELPRLDVLVFCYTGSHCKYDECDQYYKKDLRNEVSAYAVDREDGIH